MKTMSNKELLPCPFCGGKAKVYKMGMWYYIQCRRCRCMTTQILDKEDINKVWNTRNYLEKQDSSKELMEFVKFCRNASATDIRQIHDRARDLIANYKECCEKSCKEENATCKESLQVSRSDFEALEKAYHRVLDAYHDVAEQLEELKARSRQ